LIWKKKKESYYGYPKEKHQHIDRYTIFSGNINSLHFYSDIIPGTGYHWVSDSIVKLAANHIPSSTFKF